jgi:protocatechuate 3,4-dioxygenase beta subunit
MSRMCSQVLYAFTSLFLVAAVVTVALWPHLAHAATFARNAVLMPEQSYTISGAVRNHDNTPVAGALVSTRWDDPDIAIVTTDSEGNYTLTVATPGDYHIIASVFYNELDPPAQAVTIPPSRTEVDFTLAQHDTIRGVVTGPDGQPLAGATVTTAYDDPLYTSTFTDASGVYTLTVAPGIYYVSAGLYGLVSPPAQRIIVPPSHANIDFALYEPYTIQGKVYTFDGEPASGVTIATAEDDPMLAYAMSESDGSYTLIVRAGTYHINASFVGLGTSPVEVVTVPDNRTGVDFHLPQQYLIRGTVRDENGLPVAGAKVIDDASAGTTTAADGSYTLSVVAGEHWISTYSDDDTLYDGGDDIVKVSVPPAAEGVDFELRVRTRTIRGRVVDDQGRPVAMATVFATNPLENTGHAQDTAADGTYLLSVPMGVYWVHVVRYWNHYDDGPHRNTVFEPSVQQEIDVSGNSAQGVDFVLKPISGLHTLRGHVFDHEGAAVDAMISASPIDANSCEARQTVSVDATGAYTVPVKAGTYLVSAFSDGRPVLPDQRITVPSDASVDFTYPRLYAISGRVTNEKGRPLQNVLLQASTEDLDIVYNSSLTESDGWYNILVGAGTYTVTAFDDGYTSSPAQVVTVPAPPAQIDFVLTSVAPPEHVIRGRVLDESGKPARHAVVSLQGDFYGGDTVYYDGSFSRAVYPGTYTVVAGGYGYLTSEAQQVTVPAGANDLTFTVRRADESVFGKVTNEAGDPVCGARVEVSGDGGISTYVSTNSGGNFALRLPDGVYTLRASAQGYPTQTQTATVPPTATQVNFVLSASVNTVEGTVLDAGNKAIAGATVTATRGGESISTTTGTDGKYTLHLPDGGWTIAVSGAGVTGSPSSKSITVPPQQSQVDFRVESSAKGTFVYLPAIVTR